MLLYVVPYNHIKINFGGKVMQYNLDGKTILFQGDSITDCGRDRDDITSLGSGYVSRIEAQYYAQNPHCKATFINKGIGGNKTGDLFNRWDEDCINLKPDLLTIFVGINDTSRSDVDENSDFIKYYTEFLDRAVNETDAKIILMEPFVLPVTEERASRRLKLDFKIDIIRKLALKYKLNLIPLDGIFNSVSALKGYEFWAADGVHPTAAGHALIAKIWFEELEKL